jgi:hypothetical protein
MVHVVVDRTEAHMKQASIQYNVIEYPSENGTPSDTAIIISELFTLACLAFGNGIIVPLAKIIRYSAVN